MKRYAAFFILGLLVGAMIMHSFQGRELEKLYWEKENLKVELYRKRANKNRGAAGKAVTTNSKGDRAGNQPRW